MDIEVGRAASPEDDVPLFHYPFPLELEAEAADVLTTTPPNNRLQIRLLEIRSRNSISVDDDAAEISFSSISGTDLAAVSPVISPDLLDDESFSSLFYSDGDVNMDRFYDHPSSDSDL